MFVNEVHLLRRILLDGHDEAVLRVYQLTEDGFRLKLMRKPSTGESATQYMTRLSNYTNKVGRITNIENTFEGVCD